MANSDIQLIVGANRKLSYTELKNDIQSLIDRFNNSKSYKVKIGVELANKTKIRSDLVKEIQNINNKVGGSSSTTAKIKVGIDRAYIQKQYNGVIKSISNGDFAKLDGLSLIDNKTFDKMKADVQEAKRIINEFNQGILNTNSVTASPIGIDTNKLKEDVVTLENVESRITTAKKRLNSSTSALKGIGSGAEVEELVNEYKYLATEIERINSLEGQEKITAVSALESEIASYREKIDVIKASTNLKSVEAKKTAVNANEAKAAISETNRAFNKQLQLIKMINDYKSANSKIRGTRYEAELNNILSALNSGERLPLSEINAYTTSFKKLQNEISEAGLKGKSFSDIMVSGIKKFSSWFGVSQLVMKGVRGIKEMISTVTELDTAMTELKKVTDLTEQQYEEFGITASNIAKEVGATISDTINASADFARLGYNIDDASKLAEAALVYKNVGDGIDDIGEASESIISTIKAFDIEAEDAMSIVDRFNEVGNNFAISSEGIGTALKKSAAALAVSKNSLEESIGLATGMNTVVQNPEQVGTALKTLTMYLRAAKVEAEDAGESTEDMANSVSELREKILTLTNNKVDIMLDKENFKSTYQIVKEISEVWSHISEVDQASLLKLIAGKRNANTVASLIKNFKDAEEAMEAASAATGSAEEENEKYLKSIEGRKARLKASFETISGDIFDDKSIKVAISALTTLVDLADKFVSTIGTIPALAATISAALSFKNVGELINQFH